ncbi:MAG: type II secretion system protein [Bacteroidales bacterium]|nr:type II secretion system protein [Clostridia bacterium]MBR1643878.1 type II secretion system protein [Bacteroidales bacterium]
MKRNKRGFTMAEMLIVVAIIGVLGAVAFVAVNQHQRNMERLERDSVAREIFVAAQNHLTMAQSQGYMGLSGNITGSPDETDGVYYFSVYKGSGFAVTPTTLLDLMLPFGSIDETVRGGGSYIIRYQYDTATVMDVFYCSTDTRYGYDLRSATLSDLIANYRDGKESDRRNYANGKVLGWYGGAEAESLNVSTEPLKDPQIVVENGAKLWVGITDANSNNSLQLIVTGMTSKVQKVITLKSNDSSVTIDKTRWDEAKTEVDGVACDFAIVIDDITTKDLHFADLRGGTANDTPFTPGEDITVQAIAFDNTKLINIGYSAEITVNSLYEKLELTDDTANSETYMTAYINNIRHLENLEEDISIIAERKVGVETYPLQKAVQTSDMSWKDFRSDTNGNSTQIYKHNSDDDTALTTAGNYMPISPANLLSYDGQKHSVSDIQVSYAGDAGMFSTLPNDSSVKDLRLIDFDITSTSGNAGALAGTLTQSDALPKDATTNKAIPNVSNVVVYNTATFDEAKNYAETISSTGDVGGLIGKVNGAYATIEKSAASLVVRSTGGNAGGLIGTTSGGKITACYTGGHTNKGSYYKDDGTTPNYNVTAESGNAGGLVGNAGNTDIDHSYSTCSVSGTTVGGFVGTAAGSISYCYATGLVTSTDATPKEGAFAYTIAEAKVSNCKYMEIMNARPENDDYPYLSPHGYKPDVSTGFTKIDEDAASYDAFVGAPTNWKDASAYDTKLIEYYGGKYNLQTVSQLDSGNTLGILEVDFVSTHYGDWPAPEIFVINKAS